MTVLNPTGNSTQWDGMSKKKRNNRIIGTIFMIRLDINKRKEAISLDQSETVQKNCPTKKRL